MTPRSIRRAQEHKARKLARKAEKAALPSRDGDGAAAAVATQPTIRMAEFAFRNDPPNPELYDEFTPELIAEANAARERVHRRAGLLPPSQPAGTADAPSAPGVQSTSASAPGVQSTSASALDAHVRPASPARLDTEPRASASVPSPAQLTANRANSQLSTGPTSSEGKETVAFNAFRHGLAGRFVILPSENESEFKELYHGLQHEHKPSTPTEHLLIEGMAQHYWLAQRALNLQQLCFGESGTCESDQQLALYLRYQATHDRGFHKCLNDLLKLRAEKRREQNGFVSQQHKQADQTRREATEIRKQERHKWAVLLAQAKVDHQQLQNMAFKGAEKAAA